MTFCGRLVHRNALLCRFVLLRNMSKKSCKKHTSRSTISADIGTIRVQNASVTIDGNCVRYKGQPADIKGVTLTIRSNEGCGVDSVNGMSIIGGSGIIINGGAVTNCMRFVNGVMQGSTTYSPGCVVINNGRRMIADANGKLVDASTVSPSDRDHVFHVSRAHSVNSIIVEGAGTILIDPKNTVLTRNNLTLNISGQSQVRTFKKRHITELYGNMNIIASGASSVDLQSMNVLSIMLDVSGVSSVTTPPVCDSVGGSVSGVSKVTITKYPGCRCSVTSSALAAVKENTVRELTPTRSSSASSSDTLQDDPYEVLELDPYEALVDLTTTSSSLSASSSSSSSSSSTAAPRASRKRKAEEQGGTPKALPPPDLKTPVESGPDRGKCVVCTAEQAVIVCLGCQAQCVCLECCAAVLKSDQKQCPLCRNDWVKQPPLRPRIT